MNNVKIMNYFLKFNLLIKEVKLKSSEGVSIIYLFLGYIFNQRVIMEHIKN
jgi:hypothetical protein